LRAEWERAGPPVAAGTAWVAQDLKRWTVQWDRPQPWPVELRAGEPGVTNAMPLPREGLVRMWVNGDIPSPVQLARAGDRLFYVWNRRLHCVAAATGKSLWWADSPLLAFHPELSQPPLQNIAGGNAISDVFDMPNMFTRFRRPHRLLVHDGLVARLENNVETRPQLLTGDAARLQATEARRGDPRDDNALTVFDAITGKLRWREGRDTAPGHPLHRAIFLAAPAVCLGQWVAPIEQKGVLALVALTPATGRLLWKTTLGSYRHSGIVAPTSVALAADGPDLFVLSAGGAVFAVDGASGQLNWATKFKPEPDDDPRRDDWLAVAGDMVVAVSSRSKSVLGLNRRTGQVLHQTVVTGLRRVLAADDQRLFVAAGGHILAVDMAPGKETWRTACLSGVSAGAVVGDRLLVPRDNRITVLDTATGRVVETLQCATPAGDPLGNLLVANNQIFVAGMERVYALQPATAATAVDLPPPAARTPAEQARLHVAEALTECAQGRTNQAVAILRRLVADPNPVLVSVDDADRGWQVRVDQWARARLREWSPLPAAEEQAAALAAAREESRQLRATAPELGEIPWLALIETGDAATLAEARAALAAYRRELGWEPPAQALDDAQPWQLTSRGTKAIKDVVGLGFRFWVPISMMEPPSFLRRHLFYLTGKGLACLDLGTGGATVWTREGRFGVQEDWGRRKAWPHLEGDWVRGAGDMPGWGPLLRPVGHLQPLWSPAQPAATHPAQKAMATLSLVSLRTGRALWEVPVHGPLYQVAAAVGLSRTFDAAAGVLAVVDGPGVRALDLGTGATRWERTWPHEEATGVAVRGERVLVRLGHQSTVAVLDRHTGAEQGRLWFEQPREHELYCSWDASAVLCAIKPAWRGDIQKLTPRPFTVTRRALPGGETLWEHQLAEEHPTERSRMFVVGADRFGYIRGDGQLNLYDMANGNLLWTNPGLGGTTTSDLLYQPATGRLWVTRWIVKDSWLTPDAVKNKAGELVALDVTTGNVVLRQPLPDMAAGTSGLIGPGAAPWYVALGNANIAGRTSTLRALPVGATETPRAPWTEPVPAGSILICAREEYLAVDSPDGLLIFQPVSGKDSPPK
jgi:outer membrane protein assembly factor BamB